MPLVLSSDSRGPLAAHVEAHWLVCEEACIPESAPLGRDLALADSARPDSAAATLFAAARQRWPTATFPADWELRAEAEVGERGDKHALRLLDQVLIRRGATGLVNHALP